MKNIANHLIGAQEFLQKRAVHNFGQADPEYGQTLQEELDKLKRKKGVSIFISSHNVFKKIYSKLPRWTKISPVTLTN